MKSNYIQIIESELPKLTEDQLYKILVLIKNTIGDVKRPSWINRPLYPEGGIKVIDNNSFSIWTPESIIETEKHIVQEGAEIREKLFVLQFYDCYGIFGTLGKSTVKETVGDISNFIMFAKENEFDGCIEIYKTVVNPTETCTRYAISIRTVSNDKYNGTIGKHEWTNRLGLYKHLESMAKVIKHKPNYHE
jgi:hypothetical protein